MSDTPLLGLPLIAAEQAQKHVTHNEALAILDAIVQLSVKDRDLAMPPGSPAEGDRYIVAASPTDAWAGHVGDVAAWQEGAWAFFEPREGWLAYVADEDVALAFSGSGWVNVSTLISALQNLALLGVGTTADATNPFSAKLNKALWTAKYAAEGGDGDLRYTLNKETPADVLSLLFQTGFSGRLEIGLIGDDDLTVKVSPDGAAWSTALKIDKTTGALTLAGDPTSALHAATKQYTDTMLPKAGGTMTGLLTTNGQIGFPATQNPSANPNTLDDYEEGTFTPIFTAATPPTGVTYNVVQEAQYMKCGNVVFVSGGLILGSKGSGGSGAVRIGGLPFAAGGATTYDIFIVSINFSNINLDTSQTNVVGSGTSGLDYFTLYQQGDNLASAVVTWAICANNTAVSFSGFYFV
jgi:hypothetical protein